MSKLARLVVTAMAVVIVLIIGGLAVVLITGQSAGSLPGISQPANVPSSPTTSQPIPTVSEESCRNASSTMDCTFLAGNRWAGIVRNGLGQRSDLVRSVKDYSVRIARVYADSTAIVLGVEVITPNGNNYEAGNFKLTDGQGQLLKGQETSFSANIRPGQGGTTHQILVFTPPEGASAAKTLSLHFEIAEIGPASIHMLGPLFTPTPFPADQPTPTAPSMERIEGPFKFDLNLQVYQTETIEGSRVKRLSGPTEIMVDKVIITPLKILVYVKNAPLQASMVITVGDWDSYRLDPPAGAGTRQVDNIDLTEFILENVPPLSTQSGQWQIKLTVGGYNLPTAMPAPIMATSTLAPTRLSDPTPTPLAIPTPLPPVVLAVFSFKKSG